MKRIYHIPHSSTYIPREYLSEYNISESELLKYSTILSDINTDKFVDNSQTKIIFPYSRLFCDVERFDDDREIMNNIGMGVLYNVNHNLEVIRENPSLDIMKHYYDHHNKLNEIVGEYINEGVLFLDIHSYAKDPLPYEINKEGNRPEICLGVNENIDNELLNRVISIVEEFGYDYAINTPFSGCLIPSNYINDDRVQGIMIEVRKDVYSTEEGLAKIKDLIYKI